MPMWRPRLEDGSSQPMFRRIVQALADDVAANTLSVGTRLPPHRELADALSIARGTVARAYREAEKLGLVRSEVGRGTHVLAPDAGKRPYSSLLEPPIVRSDLSTSLPLSGVDPDPADVLRRLADRPDRRSLLRYHPPAGVLRHRVAGVRWLARMGVDANLDEVVLFAGAQHALFVTLAQLAHRGRAVYVEELTYPGMHGIAEMLKLRLVPVAMDEEGMSPTALSRACRKHGRGVVYCMPTIHNPTGAVMSETRRRAIAEVARAADLFLVEDAANRMLVTRPPPPLRHYAPERTFLVASVSKVLSPGLRVAFVVAPQDQRAPLVRGVFATQWMVSALGPEIVAMWLEDGVVDRTLKAKRRAATRRQAMARRVFGSRNVSAHREALHLWLSLPSAWRTDRLVTEAAKHDLVVTPSSAFWVGRSEPPRAIRIALAGVDDIGELERGLTRLAQLLR